MNDIQKAQAARILSCYDIPTNDLEKAQENDIEEVNDLEKGIIDDLSYQSKESGFIATTGKEMKAKLEVVKARNQTELSNIAVKQAALVAQIGSQPDRDDNSYQLEKYNGLISTPQTYSYECCKGVVENVPYLYEAPKAEVPEVNINELKSQYRELVYRAINLQVENLQIDTFVRNTKDTKEINLNLQIATALGF